MTLLRQGFGGQVDTGAEFVRRLIGLPWKAGAQGPDEFDCWGLARFVQWELFDRDLPVAGIEPECVTDLRAVMRRIEEHPVRAHWSEIAAPAHGDLVTMAHHQYPSHIGVYLQFDLGGVLHCVRDHGVGFDAIPALKLKGFSRLRYYRHV